MDPAYLEISMRLLLALACGGIIGLERSFHGRSAGFRTHALVCLSTSLLMLVTVYEARWFPAVAQGRVTIDPTRMAQGIMTGIGFLGAGTIMQDGLSVRGLTTAASIWITAALGVLLGIGFYFPAGLALVLTLATLSVLRRIEARMPTQVSAHCFVRFERGQEPSEDHLRELAAQRGFKVSRVGYRLEAGYVEYQLWLRGRAAAHTRDLIATLAALPAVLELRLTPTGD